MDREAATLHIAFGVDENFFRGAGVSIASILDHNPGIDFVFHVFTFGCSQSSRDRLQQMSRQRGVPMHLHALDDSVFARYRHNPRSNYSNAIFTRILMPGVLKGITDRFVYVDSDILCRGDLRPLLTLELGDHVAAAVADVQTIAERRRVAMALSGEFYFNSGLLVVDVANWNAARITEQAIELIGSGQYRLDYPDQDALNKVAEGKVLKLHPKWNVMFSLLGELPHARRKLAVSDDAVMLHFGGPLKPWHGWSHGCARAMFERHQAASGWADVPADRPRTYKQMHQCATFHRGSGRPLRSALWYGAYLGKKVSTLLKGLITPSLAALTLLLNQLGQNESWHLLLPVT